MQRYRVYLANGQYAAMCELNDELIHRLGAYPTGKTGKAMRLAPAFPTQTVEVSRCPVEGNWLVTICIDGQEEEQLTFARAADAWRFKLDLTRTHFGLWS